LTTLAPILESFFTQRLITQRRVSPHTIASYRDTFRLLLGFAQGITGKAPTQLNLTDLDAALIAAFLDHLERDRHNSIRTRNSRLVAVHSLFRYAAMREPAHAELIQRVLAIPQKRFDRATVCFLNREEIEAVLASPNQASWTGRRDHALLVVALMRLS
jgi:site-specific recombinase XerD